MTRVILFTGLSGSGKSTIAQELKKRLEAASSRVFILDGDAIRNSVNSRLGFSREDIRTNNRTIAEMALANLEKFDYILVPIISPYREDRSMFRRLIGDGLVELFVDCPIEVCMQRDVKGLYKKALSGEIKDFIGLADSNPYESPEHPDLVVKTDETDLESAIQYILSHLN